MSTKNFIKEYVEARGGTESLAQNEKKILIEMTREQETNRQLEIVALYAKNILEHIALARVSLKRKTNKAGYDTSGTSLKSIRADYLRALSNMEKAAKNAAGAAARVDKEAIPARSI